MQITHTPTQLIATVGKVSDNRLVPIHATEIVRQLCTAHTGFTRPGTVRPRRHRKCSASSRDRGQPKGIGCVHRPKKNHPREPGITHTQRGPGELEPKQQNVGRAAVGDIEFVDDLSVQFNTGLPCWSRDLPRQHGAFRSPHSFRLLGCGSGWEGRDSRDGSNGALHRAGRCRCVLLLTLPGGYRCVFQCASEHFLHTYTDMCVLYCAHTRRRRR